MSIMCSTHNVYSVTFFEYEKKIFLFFGCAKHILIIIIVITITLKRKEQKKSLFPLRKNKIRKKMPKKKNSYQIIHIRLLVKNKTGWIYKLQRCEWMKEKKGEKELCVCDKLLKI